MTADVYAGDDALAHGSASSTVVRSVRLSMVADAHPDVLLRVAATLNVLNAAPRAFRLESGEDETVVICVALDGCSEQQAEYVSRKLSQLTCAVTVSFDYTES